MALSTHLSNHKLYLLGMLCAILAWGMACIELGANTHLWFSGLSEQGYLQAWSDVFAGEGRLNSVVMFEPWPLERRLRELGGPWLQRRFEVHEEGAADMTLAAYVREGLDLELEFDRDRVDAGTAERLMASLLTLLRQMALATGDQTVASLDMLTPLDRRRLQALAVPEGGLKASSSCAMALFARTVRRRPSAVALSVLGQATTLTYAELDARSSRLAHWLRGQGVEEGDRVAICMPRGPDFVVAMLALILSEWVSRRVARRVAGR